MSSSANYLPQGDNATAGGAAYQRSSGTALGDAEGTRGLDPRATLSTDGSAASARGAESYMDDDELPENSNGPWPVTADNLGRIPEAEQLAPGIRLPNTVAQGTADDDDDEEEYDAHGQHGVSSDGLGPRRKIGPTHVGHFGPHGAPVPGVPPELDPRAAKFRRPTSPGAASVFSLAVQPPASPKAGALDADGQDVSGAYTSTPSMSGTELPSVPSRASFSLPSPSVNSSTASVFSGPPSGSVTGGLGTPLGGPSGQIMTSYIPSTSSSLAGTPVGVAASVAATAGSSSSASSLGHSRPNSIRAPSPPLSVVSAPGSDISMGPPASASAVSSMLPPTPHSGGFAPSYRTSAYQAGPSMLSRQAALASHAPSEVGSVETSSSLDAPLSSRAGGVGSHNGDALDTASDTRRMDEDEDAEPDGGDAISRRAKNIERQRMRERELLGGEAGVGGLSRPPATASLAALMRQEHGMNSYAGGPIGQAGAPGGSSYLLSPSRPGSTAATIGTASPPASAGSSSDDEAHQDMPASTSSSVLARRRSRLEDGAGAVPPESPLYGNSQMQTPALRPSPAFAFSSTNDGQHMGLGAGASAASRGAEAGAGSRVGPPVVQGEMMLMGGGLGAHRSRRSSVESTETIASSHRPATTSSSGASDAGGPDYWPGAAGAGITGSASLAAQQGLGTAGPGLFEEAAAVGPEFRSRRLEETILLDGPQIGFGKPSTPTGEERMQF